MALKVGELFATMRLDNRDFDKGLDDSKAKFTALGGVLQKGAQAAGRVFAATTTAVAGLGVAALKVGLDYNRMQQTSRAALTTLLGGAEAVNAQMAKLDDFASNSPFSKQVFIQAQQQLIGFGMAAEDVIPTLDAIQNAVAAVGGSNEDIAEISRILATVTSSGKVTAETFNQLGHRGIDAATLIGEQMGKTGAEIRESVTNGTLDAGDAVEALVAGMTANFGGATDLIKQQMDGAADRVKAAWRDIGSVMATPLIDPNGGGQLVEWTNLFADGLRQIQRQAGPVTDILWGRMGPGIDMVTAGMKQANAAIAGWNPRSFETSLDKISGYAPLIAATSAALFAMGTTNLPILSQLGLSGINPVVAGVAALVAFSPQLRAVGMDFLRALEPGIQPASELARIIADFLMSALDRLSPALSDTAVAGAEVAVALLGGLVPAVQGATDVATPLIGIVADVASGLAKLPTPVLAAVTAFAAMKALNVTGLLGGIAAKGAGPFVTAFKNVQQTLQASRDTSALLGMELSRTQNLMLAGRASASSFGAALKTAFMTNAPLIALTAVVTALTIFSQKAAEARDRARAYGEVMKQVGDDAAKLDAALEDFTRNAFVTGEGLDWGGWQSFITGSQSAADAVEALGLSLDDVVGAVHGTDAEFEAFIQTLMEMEGLTGRDLFRRDEIITKMHQQRNATSDAERTQAQLNDAMDRGAAMADAQSDAYKAAADATDRLRRAEQDLAAAKGDLVLAQYAADDAMTRWAERVTEVDGVVRDHDGTLQKSGDAWRSFEEGGIGARNALMQVAENMQKAGASQSEINTYIEDGTARWIAQAEALGLTEDEALAYIESLGGIPDVKSTKVELGADSAYSELSALLQEIEASHGKILIDASSSPAHAELLTALGLVNNGEGVFTIDAASDPATAELALTLGEVDTSTGTVTIDGDNKESLQELRTAEAAINRGKGTVSILGRDQTASTRQEAVNRINAAHGNIKVGAVDSGAIMSAENIRRSINSMRATIQVGTRQIGGSMVASAADGGLFLAGIQTFADGGFSSLPSQATIMAAQGAGLVQWAEAETEGEGFVPLALSKRKRSLEIMHELARRFDHVLIPRPTRSFADGGITGSQASTTSQPAAGPSLTVGHLSITVPVDQIEQMKSIIDFERMLRLQLAQN